MEDVQLYIGGAWRPGRSGQWHDVVDPATSGSIGRAAHAGPEDLDQALNAAAAGFDQWRGVPAFQRYKLMRRSAVHLRDAAAATAVRMTAEQGKPLAEAKAEALAAADIIDWSAEKGRRAYGRLIPSRTALVTQAMAPEPVGPVAAFTPWNLPMNQPVPKVAAAVAAGCSIIIKGSEETPSRLAAIVSAFDAAGLPPGVLNAVFGIPDQISRHLIASPVIRKISFTGSTMVSRHLASLAGQHLKRMTKELGSHAPVLVFSNADMEQAAAKVAAAKYRNASQVCTSPTRIHAQRPAYAGFVTSFVAKANAQHIGSGVEQGVSMGPLISERRVVAIETMVADAVDRSGRIAAGGRRLGNRGIFLRADGFDRRAARSPHHERGAVWTDRDHFTFRQHGRGHQGSQPVALWPRRLSLTRSAETIAQVQSQVECGMMSINHHGLAQPETPFGGVRDSGW